VRDLLSQLQSVYEKQIERLTGMFVVPTLVGRWLFKSPTEVGTTCFSHTLSEKNRLVVAPSGASQRR